MRKLCALVIVIVFIIFGLSPTAGLATQQVISLEEAIARVKPSVGILYRLIDVEDLNGNFVKNFYETGGTLTVFHSNPNTSCAAITAHSTLEPGKIGEPYEDRVLRIRVINKFRGEYFATFDGRNLIRTELVAKRGDFLQQNDFAVFKIATSNIIAIELGDESMVRQGTEVFTVHAPLGRLGASNIGSVSRHSDDPFPVTGSSLPDLRKLFILDIKGITHGSSGAFVYVIKEKIYAFAMIQGYWVAGTPTNQIGETLPYAIPISLFKKFINEEKVLEKCK